MTYRDVLLSLSQGMHVIFNNSDGTPQSTPELIVEQAGKRGNSAIVVLSEINETEPSFEVEVDENGDIQIYELGETWRDHYAELITIEIVGE